MISQEERSHMICAILSGIVLGALILFVAVQNNAPTPTPVGPVAAHPETTMIYGVGWEAPTSITPTEVFNDSNFNWN